MIFFFDDFNDQVDTFNTLFQETLDLHAPIKRIKIKSKPNPFVSAEIRHLMKTRDKWHKHAKKTNDKLHWNAYRFFRQEVRCELRLAEKSHVRSQLLNCNRNTNSIWKVINRCLPQKNTQNSFSTCENPLLLANKFNEFFTSVGSDTAKKAHSLAIEQNVELFSSVPTQVTQCENLEAFRFQMVTTHEVEKVIKGFSSSKISSRFLKDSLPITLTAITHLMNNSFISNTFAKAWKVAEVVPILKSSIDIENPCNSRPISLLPILSKVSERLAPGQFINYLTRHKKLAQNQSKNRKLFSTETSLLHVTDELLKAMDDKNISALVLLDMSKAFDSINHDILLQKLHSSGVSNHSLRWFKSYLSDRHQGVSDLHAIRFGVPLGSISGPVLFTIYVNDLVSVPVYCLLC